MDSFDEAIKKHEEKIKELKRQKKDAELRANAPIGKAARKVFGDNVPKTYRDAVLFFEQFKTVEYGVIIHDEVDTLE